MGTLMLANQGIAAHGPLEPDATWTRWADFTCGAWWDRNYVVDQTMSQELDFHPNLWLKPLRCPSKEMCFQKRLSR
eukprot:3584317-Amphidinium_carterae.1